MAEEEVFEQFVVGAWEAKGKTKIPFPISRLTQSYANRIAKRRRPYQDGWKLDDTGSDGVTWEVESIFHNGHNEDGLPEVLYPDHADKLCASFVVHETGTFTSPTRGPRRARLESFRRVEDAGLRDACTITMTFLEDNEAGMDAGSFAAPSAQAIARTLASDTIDALAKAGCWSSTVASINELAAGLQNLANAPGEFVGDFEAQANATLNAVESVEHAFSSASSELAQESGRLLLDPEASRAGRLLRRLGDTARRATIGRVAGGMRSKRYAREVSLFDVSKEEAVRFDELLRINAGLPDPFRIPAGTPVVLPEV